MKKFVSLALLVLISVSLISCSGYKSIGKGDTGISIQNSEKQVDTTDEKKGKKGK